jgi:hypothetical protein
LAIEGPNSSGRFRPNRRNTELGHTAELNRLAKSHPEIHKNVAKYLQYDHAAVNLLLFRLSITADDNKIDPSDILENCISPLMKQNPSLSRPEHMDSLRKFGGLFLDLGIKTEELELKFIFNSFTIYRHGINPLLEQNPALSRIENIDHLKKFSELLIELGTEAKNGEITPHAIIKYGFRPLLEQNPEMAKIENIDSLKKFIKCFTDLEIEANANKIDALALFNDGIHTILTGYPDLAKAENIPQLKKYGKFMIEMGVKARQHKIDPSDFFEEIMYTLLKERLGMLWDEHIEFIRQCCEKAFIEADTLEQ